MTVTIARDSPCFRTSGKIYVLTYRYAESNGRKEGPVGIVNEATVRNMPLSHIKNRGGRKGDGGCYSHYNVIVELEAIGFFVWVDSGHSYRL